MPNLTLLNLSSDVPEPSTSEITTLDLKSGWREDQPYAVANAIYNKEFSVVNLPAEFFRRGAVTTKEALAHELIFACLSLKSLVLQDVLPSLQQFRANDWEADVNHPALIPLRNPNPDNTFGDLLAFVTTCEDVFGVAYLEKINNRFGGVVGLQPLDPRTVFERAKPGVATFPTFWEAQSCYRLQDIDHYVIEEGGVSRRLEVDEVITIKTHDVRSPLAGQTAVRAAGRAVGVDINLNNYVDAYLLAGGPSGLLKIKNKQLTDEEAQDLQERWERRHRIQGSKRSAKIAVLDEDGDFQQIGAHLEGLASDVLKQHDQAAICSTMGVPGQLVSAYFAIRWGNQRAGQEAALREFWELHLSPRLTRYRSRFDKSFLVDFDGRSAGITTRVFWDLSNVKALQEDIDRKATRYSTAYKDKAVSKNEYRAQLGLKPVDGGDFIPNDEDAYKEAQKRFEQDAKAPADGDSEKDNQKKSLKAKRNPPKEEAEQVPAVEKAQDESKATLTAILLLIKAGLIQQAIDKLRQLQDDFTRLHLTLTPEAIAEINGAIEAAYRSGAATMATGATIQPVEVEKILTIASVLTGMLTTGVAARLISSYALRKLRGMAIDAIVREVEAEARAESTAWYEQLASGAAFQAIADGRGNEMRARKPRRYYYSAILDKNLCDFCREEDGKYSKKIEDLMPVPNPFCDGRWRCRCIHVAVFEEQ